MAISEQLLRTVFTNSWREFVRREADHIRADPSERNLCASFSQCLRRQWDSLGIDGYFADAEYNRKQQGKVKTIVNGEQKVVSVVVDLILHSRGGRTPDNLIAIEMKKAARPVSEKASDRDRLIAMTSAPLESVWSANGVVHPEHVCGYLLGVFVEIDVARNAFSIEFFAEGRSAGSESGSF